MSRVWEATKSKDWPFLLTAIAVVISVFVYYLAAESRFLYLSETGNWFYFIVNFQTFEFHPELLRRLDLVWQFFGILYSKFAQGPTLAGGFNVLTVAHLAPQILSLIVSYFVLKRNQTTQFIVFQLLYWGLIGLSSSIFVVNAATTGAAFFWPVFYFLVFTSTPKVTSQILGILATIAVIMSHESNLVLVAMIAVVLFFSRSKLNANFYKVWMLLAIAGSFIMIWFSWFYLSQPNRFPGSDFRGIFSLKFGFGTMRNAGYVCLLATILIAHLLVILKRSGGPYRELFRHLWLSGTIFALATWYYSRSGPKYDRVFVSITCFVLAALCVYYARKEKDLFKSHGFVTSAQAVIIVFLLNATTQLVASFSFAKQFAEAKAFYQSIPEKSCVTAPIRLFSGTYVFLVLLDYPKIHFPERIYISVLEDVSGANPCETLLSTKDKIFPPRFRGRDAPKVVNFSRIEKTAVWGLANGK